MKNFNFLFFIVSIFLIVSCSPQKKLDRLVDKHPHLMEKDTVYETQAIALTDTIVEIDTFVTEKIKVKHLFAYKTDTVFTLAEGRLETKVKIVTKDVPYPVIEIESEVGSDTIIQLDTLYYNDTLYIEVPKEITTYDIRRGFNWNWLWLVLTILGLLLVWIFRDFLLSFFK